MKPGTAWKRLGIGLGILIVLWLGAYASIMWEGSSARRNPPAWEASIGQWLLGQTVPVAARQQVSPLVRMPDTADIDAGQLIYRQKCETCHAYDGGGHTDIGAGQYPHPPDLRASTVQGMSDGELHYHIANGIRHTGMPAWDLDDRRLWQVVLYLRHLPAGSQSLQPVAADAAPDLRGAHYVGSQSCRGCHSDIYERWRKTRMANVVRDPKAHPDAIAPDFNKTDPALTFTKDQVALVYGSRWKQRYFTKVGADYFPLPAQWDFTHKTWSKYFVKPGTDWWEAHYPPDNMQRPTGPLCDGCHSVNYDIARNEPTEWNVGCERCHGPGSTHVMDRSDKSIVNPAKLDYVHGNDICISCHSQGQPLTNPINGRYYDWPVGYHVGKNLVDFWKLEEHKLGEQTFTHFADGTAHKNRMQGNDFVTSLMYTRGVTCFACHDVHGNDNVSLLRKPGSETCMACHGPNTQNGPHAPSIEAHTHHKPGSPGSDCIACHMPRIEQEIADTNVHAHTFRFITPATTESLQVPNPCGACHQDKSNDWLIAALKSWNDRSPWRVAQ
jgi:predicted CXXCH cytochrome family protein